MKFYRMLDLEFTPWTEKLVGKLTNSEYRHAYVAEGVKTWIARQIRTLREQRGWSQGDLGAKMDKPQSTISRLEDPDYGKLSLQTLLEIAEAYDVGLVVKFVDFPTFVRHSKSIDTDGMHVDSFSASQFRTSKKFGMIQISSSSELAQTSVSTGMYSGFHANHLKPSNYVSSGVMVL